MVHRYMDQDVYKTKDLSEAAALYASGVKFHGLEKTNNYYWFIFENANAERISSSFWSGELTINAKAYSDSYRTLKDRLFSQNISFK